MQKRIAIMLTLIAVAVLATFPARAEHQLLHACGVKAAPARFPAGFGTPNDAECGYPIGGFGGVLADDAAWNVPAPSGSMTRHAPLILVHGNVVDHADWYPVRDEFIRSGWHPGDIWALSYNGLGNASGSGATANPRRDDEHTAAGSDGLARNTGNEINAPDVCAFILRVRAFTGSDRFSVAGHSLGVTVARRALEMCVDAGGPIRRDLVAFIGIAGGNHGTSLCPPGSEGRLSSCDEIATGTPWLNAMNATPDEFGDAAVMTVYDGTGVSDVAFTGPLYAHSPRLADIAPGALDCVYGRGHNDLRMSPTISQHFRRFLDAAETGAAKTCGADALPVSSPMLP